MSNGSVDGAITIARGTSTSHVLIGPIQRSVVTESKLRGTARAYYIAGLIERLGSTVGNVAIRSDAIARGSSTRGKGIASS